MNEANTVSKSVSREQTLLATAERLFQSALRCPDAPPIVKFIADEQIYDGSLPYDQFRSRYWLQESFSKAPWEVDGVDRQAAAMKKFFRAEEQCREVNHRLLDHLVPSIAPHGVLGRARLLVRQVLGEFSWDACVPYFSFGPGATTQLPRRLASHAYKWELGAHITAECLPVHLTYLRYTGVRPSANLKVVEGNRVTTVPKNWKTDRVIAIEPDWNMFYQRGIGGLIRRRLRSRLQLLTPKAQQYHRHLAMVGSQTRDLATIDLASASDTVSLALCEALLPQSWYRAMLMVRSPVGTIGGETVSYEKISSMGNGFTFELETLLFWALARATSKDGLVSVYGDDIIVNTNCARGVIDTLEASGFEINLEKSHYSVVSPFRESCGGHFYDGVDVTPPYYRKLLKEPMAWQTAANRTLEAATRVHSGHASDVAFKPLWDWLITNCSWFGPSSLGDSVAHVPFDYPKGRRRSRCRYNSSLHRLEVRGLVADESHPIAHNTWGGVLASLFGRPTEESSYFQQWRYKPAWLPASSWTGPVIWV